MLFSDTYLTIETPQQIIFKDKGSKFLAFAFPVENDKQIKDSLSQLKKEHPTANHHCFSGAQKDSNGSLISNSKWSSKEYQVGVDASKKEDLKNE